MRFEYVAADCHVATVEFVQGHMPPYTYVTGGEMDGAMVAEKLRLPPTRYGAPGVVVDVLDWGAACLVQVGLLELETTCPYVHSVSLPGAEHSPAKTVSVPSSATEAVKAEVPGSPMKGRLDVRVRGFSDDASSSDDVLRKSRSTESPVGENMYSPRLVRFSHAHVSESSRIVVGTYGTV